MSIFHRLLCAQLLLPILSSMSVKWLGVSVNPCHCHTNAAQAIQMQQQQHPTIQILISSPVISSDAELTLTLIGDTI